MCSILWGMPLANELSGIETWVASLEHGYWLMLMASIVAMGSLESSLYSGVFLVPEGLGLPYWKYM